MKRCSRLSITKNKWKTVSHFSYAFSGADTISRNKCYLCTVFWVAKEWKRIQMLISRWRWKEKRNRKNKNKMQKNNRKIEYFFFLVFILILFICNVYPSPAPPISSYFLWFTCPWFFPLIMISFFNNIHIEWIPGGIEFYHHIDIANRNTNIHTKKGFSIFFYFQHFFFVLFSGNKNVQWIHTIKYTHPELLIIIIDSGCKIGGLRFPFKS